MNKEKDISRFLLGNSTDHLALETKLKCIKRGGLPKCPINEYTRVNVVTCDYRSPKQECSLYRK